MATITHVSTQDEGNVTHTIWETIGNADVGTALDLPGASDRSVMITGTHGGATTTVEGSNDLLAPVTWVTLHDITGTEISYTTSLPELQMILENPRWIRCQTTGGSTTDVDVQLISRGTK